MICLSRRELAVLAMYVNGATMCEIAQIMRWPLESVKSSRRDVVERFRDVGLADRADKVALGILLNAEPRQWYVSNVSIGRAAA